MDAIRDSIKRTLCMEGLAVSGIIEKLDMPAVQKVVDLLVNCKGRVVVSGCGTSSAAAKKIVHTLNCVECAASFLSPADAIHGALGIVRKEDIVILISKGGATPEITQLIPICKEKEAIVIAITGNEASELAVESDVLLKVYTENEPDRFNMLATSSILTVIAVMDAIAICVMDRNGFTEKKFSVIHPGGAVGELLKSKTC